MLSVAIDCSGSKGLLDSTFPFNGVNMKLGIVLLVVLTGTLIAIAGSPTAAADDILSGEGCTTHNHLADVCSNLSCPGYVTVWVANHDETIICF